MSDHTDEYDDVDSLDEDMAAKDIEALGLSVDELKAHYAAGELNHLSEEELRGLLNSATARDLQKTIVR